MRDSCFDALRFTFYVSHFTFKTRGISVFYKLILWGVALYLAAKSVRSLLASWGGVWDTRNPKEKQSRKAEFGDVEDAEFEDIEEAS